MHQDENSNKKKTGKSSNTNIDAMFNSSKQPLTQVKYHSGKHLSNQYHWANRNIMNKETKFLNDENSNTKSSKY